MFYAGTKFSAAALAGEMGIEVAGAVFELLGSTVGDDVSIRVHVQPGQIPECTAKRLQMAVQTAEVLCRVVRTWGQ